MYDESSLRSVSARYYAHLHRICEIVLAAGGEFAVLAKGDRFFENLKSSKGVWGRWRAELQRALPPSRRRLSRRTAS